jgi:hypothetical protein
MVTILPVRSPPSFPPVVSLTSLTGDEMNRPRDGIFATIIPNKQVNMITGNHIIKDTKVESLLCFIKPFQPFVAVSSEFKKEFFFMATVSDMPN